MIRSFKNSETERIFQAEYVSRLSGNIQKTAYRRLLSLNAAVSLNDLSALPGNRVEKLKGARAGQYSIRINDQWRVCFEWIDNNAENVEIVDYHKYTGIRLMTEKIPPVHPGEILLEDYLIPSGINQHQLALAMRVPANRISEIVKGKRSITAETALRLGRAIGTSPEFWLNLQAQYDLQVAQETFATRINQEVIPLAS
jgi:addiction module HigA family antidote